MSTTYPFAVRMVSADGKRCEQDCSIVVGVSGYDWCNLVWTYTSGSPNTTGSASCGTAQGQSSPVPPITTQGATLEGIGTYGLAVPQNFNIHVVYNATYSPGYPTFGDMDIEVDFGSGYTFIFHGLWPFTAGPLNYPPGTYDLPVTIPALSPIVGIKIPYGAKCYTTHPGTVDFTCLITNV